MPTVKPTSPVKASTQVFIEIEDIKDDIILLKDFSAVTVIEVGAVNYWLLSVEEQTSMIYAYGGLLNSLSFPVEVLILSKMMNISSYLDFLDGKIAGQRDDSAQARLKSYKDFIKNIVKKNTVLEKRFFFIIPFNPLELGASGMNPRAMGKDYIISRAKTSLYPKRDHLLRLLLKVGLKPTILEKQALTELFYDVYNPIGTGSQIAPVDSYTDVVVTSG